MKNTREGKLNAFELFLILPTLALPACVGFCHASGMSAEQTAREETLALLSIIPFMRSELKYGDGSYGARTARGVGAGALVMAAAYVGGKALANYFI